MTVASAPRNYPQNVTSYDVLKTLAVALMIVDHVGYYFFWENDWWRVVGRMSAPIWLFLVGYALSRDFSAKLWIGAGILFIANILTGPSVFPLNILFTILFVRWVLDHVASYMMATLERLLVISLVLSGFMIPSYFILEYGLHGIQIAVFGYALRRHQDGTDNQATQFNVILLMGIALAAYLYNESLVFGFNMVESTVMAVCVSFVFGLLYSFKSREHPSVQGGMRAILQLGGRRTLEIYVVHILLFKALAVILDYPSVQVLQPQLFPL